MVLPKKRGNGKKGRGMGRKTVCAPNIDDRWSH